MAFGVFFSDRTERQLHEEAKFRHHTILASLKFPSGFSSDFSLDSSLEFFSRFSFEFSLYRGSAWYQSPHTRVSEGKGLPKDVFRRYIPKGNPGGIFLKGSYRRFNRTVVQNCLDRTGLTIEVWSLYENCGVCDRLIGGICRSFFCEIEGFGVEALLR